MGVILIVECLVLSYLMKERGKIRISKIKFRIGDKVRISRTKSTFEKGYLANWSEEIFTVHKIKYSQPITYVLKDLSGEIVQGSFYVEELQKTNQQVFRIEKVLKTKMLKGKKKFALVKYVGYSDKFNEWIPADYLDLV